MALHAPWEQRYLFGVQPTSITTALDFDSISVKSISSYFNFSMNISLLNSINKWSSAITLEISLDKYKLKALPIL